jgi:hypothetical protein
MVRTPVLPGMLVYIPKRFGLQSWIQDIEWKDSGSTRRLGSLSGHQHTDHTVDYQLT